jgi:hypothetical protein
MTSHHLAAVAYCGHWALRRPGRWTPPLRSLNGVPRSRHRNRRYPPLGKLSKAASLRLLR